MSIELKDEIIQDKFIYHLGSCTYCKDFTRRISTILDIYNAFNICQCGAISLNCFDEYTCINGSCKYAIDTYILREPLSRRFHKIKACRTILQVYFLVLDGHCIFDEIKSQRVCKALYAEVNNLIDVNNAIFNKWRYKKASVIGERLFELRTKKLTSDVVEETLVLISLCWLRGGEITDAELVLRYLIEYSRIGIKNTYARSSKYTDNNLPDNR